MDLQKNVGLFHQSFTITRRKLLQVGVGVFGLVGASRLGWAALCPSHFTPRQTRGPFFPYDQAVSFPIRENLENTLPLIEANDNDLTMVEGKPGKAQGHIIYFRGQVLHPAAKGRLQSDGCRPLAGATIFLWQANFSGRYNHKDDDTAIPGFPHPRTGKLIERVHDEYFQYWGKAISDEQGYFQFKTIMPSFYPAAEDWYRPPHFHFSIRAKGSPEFITQTYFKGDDLPNSGLIRELNAKDWILRNPNISQDQQERVIVEFRQDPEGIFGDGLVGTCQFLLPL